MKQFIICALVFASININAKDIKEKKVNSKVNEVTVFLNSAQVMRNKSVDLESGTTLLKFVGLSPFIDAKSIQVKANGEVMVLAVNHQRNFLKKMEKPVELINFENRLIDIETKINLENTYLDIIKEELSFLQTNKHLGGKEQPISAADLKESSEFYGQRYKELRLSELNRQKELKKLTVEKSDIQSQIRNLTNTKEFPSGEILVRVNSKKVCKARFELSYLVGNAGWNPSYDIRATSINEPIQLIYKANVRQDTKVDWANVKIRFSSSDPKVSGVLPTLKPYFIKYGSRAPSYTSNVGQVSGSIYDAQGTPLPGVNIVVEGSTIGTVTDLNGNYSLTVPPNGGYLHISYIGYVPKKVKINQSNLNIQLDEDIMALEEIVVIGYGTQKKFDVTGAVSSLGGRQSSGVHNTPRRKPNVKIRGTNSIEIPTQKVEKQTTVDFEINTPYSVKSDNQSYSVDMVTYELPASYQYFCIPKINKNVFLMAHIVEWEKYNLLEGEANIFFEDTYIGKTLLDVRYTADTLHLSLGTDKNVIVNREKAKDYTSKKWIGNKKIENRAYETYIKNNKIQEISLLVVDQVPVSTIEEVEVDVKDLSGGKLNEENGEVRWEMELKPGGKKELDLKYSVKFPMSRNLIIE